MATYSMINPFADGDSKTFTHIVQPEDAAGFGGGVLHPVYATFALARDAEWSGRLFVLDMKEDDEEGIGTSITVVHHAPAHIGSEVVFTAVLAGVRGNEIATRYEATSGDRLIASGEQKQKILKKARIAQLLAVSV